jgi:hypothetical protein
MADEDNFDIDIYGDDVQQDYQEAATEQNQKPVVDVGGISNNEQQLDSNAHGANQGNAEQDAKMNGMETSYSANDSQQMETDSKPQNQTLAQTAVQQGTKRKEGSDDRPIDPGATTALLISDLAWWEGEDDIRGWANQAQCEDELKEVTFNEHKVNGKSKGQAFVDLASQQAATALKHKIDSLSHETDKTTKKHAQFHNPHTNPYKTLPKDNPGRNAGNRPDNRGGNFQNNQGNNQRSFSAGNFRGGGNFNNRGGMNNNTNNMGGGFNRNFTSPPMGGMPNTGSFGGPPMGGFNANSMGMQQFGNAFNRGGMMGAAMRGGMPQNRGGRGGMNPGMMGNMGMGGMGMPGMPMGNMGMGAMQGGFGGQGHFNPLFFNQNQGGGDGGNWNPHGAKRPRPE